MAKKPNIYDVVRSTIVDELLALPRHSVVGDPLHGHAMAERAGGRWVCFDDVEALAARITRSATDESKDG